jgi:hypothetical protein
VAKDKLGEQWSQPHLPGMDVKPSDEARWPHGYTPERRDEVRWALNKVDVHDARARRLTWPSIQSQYATIQADHKFRADTESAIARSTMPREHLEDLKAIRQTGAVDEIRDANGNYTSYDYEHKGSTVRMNTDHQDREGMGKRTSREMTLIHELGHHNHYFERTGGTGAPLVPGEANQSEWTLAKREWERGPDKKGNPILEARAEEYGREHWRQDPREARKRPTKYVANYDEIADYHLGWDYEDRAKFNEIYHGVQNGAQGGGRGGKPIGPDTRSLGRRLYEANDHSLAPERGTLARGQGRLFARNADALLTDTTFDYGQHPLSRTVENDDPVTNPDQFRPKTKQVDVGTIRVGRGPQANDLQIPGAPKLSEDYRYGPDHPYESAAKFAAEAAVNQYREKVMVERAGITPKKNKGKTTRAERRSKKLRQERGW